MVFEPGNKLYSGGIENIAGKGINRIGRQNNNASIAKNSGNATDFDRVRIVFVKFNEHSPVSL